MNPADQIEVITRRATDAVLAAAHDYSARRRELAERPTVAADLAAQEVAEQARTAAQTAVLRDRLTRTAELADNATPQILLPADVAAGSPHRGQPGFDGTGH